MTHRTLSHRGCPLAYDLRGSGPPVLFIQGVGVHGDGWRPQTDPLSERFACLSFDNRGMGRSQPAGGEITVDQMADDARAILDDVGWDSAHVVGHSLGGLVATQLALLIPRRMRSLTLMCTFASGRRAAPLTFRMMWLGMRTRIGTRRMRRRAFLRLVMPAQAVAGQDADALTGQLADVFGHDLADQPPVVSAQLKAMRRSDAAPRLGELAGIPTLVMGGEHDPIAPPRVIRVLADGIPGAIYQNFPDASHGLPIQFAAEVNARLENHLNSAEKARS